MSEDKDKNKNIDTSSNEYLKYSGQTTEKEAARAMYEYFNTGKYIQQIRSSC